MITLRILYLILILFSSLNKISSLNLLFLIIILRIILSRIFFLHNLSFLGLIWIIVYLGGMMIIFIYIIFLKKSQNFSENNNNFSFQLRGERFFKLIFKVLTFVVFFKLIFFKFKLYWEIYNQILTISPRFSQWEIYNQILTISPRFIWILLLVIILCLIFILRVLKKNRIISLKKSLK